MVAGPIAFVPEVDGPILAAGYAHRRNVEHLRGLGFDDEAQARRHIDRLATDVRLANDYDTAQQAWERLYRETTRDRGYAGDLAGLLDRMPADAATVSATGVRTDDLRRHCFAEDGLARIRRRLATQRTPALLDAAVRAHSALENQLKVLNPDGLELHSEGAVVVDDDELAERLGEPGPRDRFLGLRGYARLLHRLDWSVAWASYVRSRPDVAELVLDPDVNTRICAAMSGDGRFDNQAEAVLQSLGFGPSYDAAEQALRLAQVVQTSPRHVQRTLQQLELDRGKLLELTGEDTMAGALRQVRQSEGWPQRQPSRVVSGGLPSLGRRH